MQLSKKRKTFPQFFDPFLKTNSNFKHFEKTMAVKTNVFPEFKTTKDVVRLISKKPCFRTSFDSQHVKGLQTPVKSVWQQFYHNSRLLWVKLIQQMSPLVICEILEAFVNTLTVNGRFSFRNCENLPLPIQMQLSKKRKTFCSISGIYIKS